MKKWIFLLALFIPLVGFGQSPGKTFRVADRTTAFGTNLPAGTMIYCVSDSTNWNVKSAGVVSTRTINTAWVAAEIEWIRTTVQTTRDKDQVNLIIDSLKANEHTISIDSATTTNAGVMTASMVTKLNGIATGSGAFVGETFESATDSLTVTGSGYYTLTLSNVCKDSTAFTVSVNGVELKHVAAGQYTVMVPNLAAKRVQLNVPIYKYDMISVSYMK